MAENLRVVYPPSVVNYLVRAADGGPVRKGEPATQVDVADVPDEALETVIAEWVAEFRANVARRREAQGKGGPMRPPPMDRWERAARLLAGALSTHPDYSVRRPESVLNAFLADADRGWVGDLAPGGEVPS